MTLSDLSLSEVEKYLTMTRSIARSLCDSWASCWPWQNYTQRTIMQIRSCTTVITFFSFGNIVVQCVFIMVNVKAIQSRNWSELSRNKPYLLSSV